MHALQGSRWSGGDASRSNTEPMARAGLRSARYNHTRNLRVRSGVPTLHAAGAFATTLIRVDVLRQTAFTN
jgi:hypothetical protein